MGWLAGCRFSITILLSFISEAPFIFNTTSVQAFFSESFLISNKDEFTAAYYFLKKISSVKEELPAQFCLACYSIGWATGSNVFHSFYFSKTITFYSVWHLQLSACFCSIVYPACRFWNVASNKPVCGRVQYHPKRKG